LWGSGAPSACGPGEEARRRSRAGRCVAGDAGKKKGKRRQAPTGGAGVAGRERARPSWAERGEGRAGRARGKVGRGELGCWAGLFFSKPFSNYFSSFQT
jgi:hypothetical protein